MLKILPILYFLGIFLNSRVNGLETDLDSSIDPNDATIATNEDIAEDQMRIENHMEPIEPYGPIKNVIFRHVNFYLYTQKNSTYEKLDRLHPTVKNNTKIYIFMVHGWLEHRLVVWYRDLKNALLARNKNYAVIQVDWNIPAHQLYHISAHNTRYVGNIIGQFILNLSKNSKVSIKNFIVIGHSLGGQASGFVGKTLLEKGHVLPRIIALDPAGPLFFFRPFADRLNNVDAKIVFVIHTDGGTYGFRDPCGTIDFFPNGGSRQPGCIAGVCNHRRSWKYFIDALDHPNDYMAKECNSYDDFLNNKCDNKSEVSMGDMETDRIGKFYLKTIKHYVDNEAQNVTEM